MMLFKTTLFLSTTLTTLSPVGAATPDKVRVEEKTRTAEVEALSKENKAIKDFNAFKPLIEPEEKSPKAKEKQPPALAERDAPALRGRDAVKAIKDAGLEVTPDRLAAVRYLLINTTLTAPTADQIEATRALMEKKIAVAPNEAGIHAAVALRAGKIEDFDARAVAVMKAAQKNDIQLVKQKEFEAARRIYTLHGDVSPGIFDAATVLVEKKHVPAVELTRKNLKAALYLQNEHPGLMDSLTAQQFALYADAPTGKMRPAVASGFGYTPLTQGDVEAALLAFHKPRLHGVPTAMVGLWANPEDHGGWEAYKKLLPGGGAFSLARAPYVAHARDGTATQDHLDACRTALVTDLTAAFPKGKGL